MAQFKVGDLVRVVSERPDNKSFVDYMAEYLGKTMKVYHVFEDKETTYWLDGAEFPGWCHLVFREDWLMPAFKLEIGENVKVDDAIGHIIHREISCGKTVYIIELPVKEETKPETKKRKPLEVFAKLNDLFDWYWDIEYLSLVVGIREYDGSEDDKEYKRKEFSTVDEDATKQAYKWLVKKACEMCDTFDEWYNGQD